MPLTNLTRLKIALGITDDDSDDLLDQLREEAEAAAARIMRRNLMSASYTEYYDGPCSTTLILRNSPVTAVAGVWIDAYGAAGQASGSFSGDALTAGMDYFSRSLGEDERNPGELIRYVGWQPGVGNIKVQYTAGYSTCPPDVQGAIHAIVARMRADIQQGRPMQSETLGAYSYSLLMGGDEGKEMSSARAMLLKYRRVVL